MSTTTTEPQANPTPPTSAAETLGRRAETIADRRLRMLADLKTAREAMLLDDAAQVLRDDRNLVRRHNEQAGFQPVATDAQDESMIHVGDIIVQQAESQRVETPAPEPVPKAASAAPPAAANSKLGLPAKIALVASLVGAGAAGPLIAQWMNQPQPPAAVEFEDTDTDTHFMLEIVED